MATDSTGLPAWHFLVLQIMSVMANDATESSLKEQKAKSFAKMELINTLSQQAASISDPTVKSRSTDASTPLPTVPCSHFRKRKKQNCLSEIR